MNNKLVVVSTAFVLFIGLVSCTDNYSKIPHIEKKLNVNVLNQIQVNEDTYTVLCIDGVKYLQTAQGGITAKFIQDNEGDPFPESCVNQ